MIHLSSNNTSMIVIIAFTVIGWYIRGMSSALREIRKTLNAQQNTLMAQGQSIARIQGHLNISD